MSVDTDFCIHDSKTKRDPHMILTFLDPKTGLYKRYTYVVLLALLLVPRLSYFTADRRQISHLGSIGLHW